MSSSVLRRLLQKSLTASNGEGFPFVETIFLSIVFIACKDPNPAGALHEVQRVCQGGRCLFLV